MVLGDHTLAGHVISSLEDGVGDATLVTPDLRFDSSPSSQRYDAISATQRYDSQAAQGNA